MKKLIKILFEAATLIFALSIWLYSFYRIAIYIKLDKILAVRASCSFPNPPCPSNPPFPPCPPGCCVPTPTPTPTIEPIATPTLPVPTLTSAPSPSPTPSISLGVSPTPTSPPAVGGNGGGGGESVEPHCDAQVPPQPNLKKATRIDQEKVELFWGPVSPVTHYNISYGFSSGNYLYGVSNTGNVTSFMVGGLQSGADYCFVVRAVNDCSPGNLSNEICTGAVGGQVLGASVLGATGSASEQLSLILFIIGCLCTSLGIRLIYPAKKLV